MQDSGRIECRSLWRLAGTVPRRAVRNASTVAAMVASLQGMWLDLRPVLQHGRGSLFMEKEVELDRSDRTPLSSQVQCRLKSQARRQHEQHIRAEIPPSAPF